MVLRSVLGSGPDMDNGQDDGILERGRSILRAEGEAVLGAAQAPDASFCPSRCG